MRHRRGRGARSALEKLQATIEQHVPDPDERRWVEPRLAHLLGLEEGAPGEQENLFSAWRILFERLAEQGPTILVFEDMQWADTGLLDFLEYLLEWSRGQPLFVARAGPPGARRQATDLGRRQAQLRLPLPRAAPAAGDERAPDGARARLSGGAARADPQRAEGVPLYAVETVRMLLDRGLLVPEGNVYRPTGPVGTLEVPETLHALVAARLDSLTQEERRLVQNGAVLGKTFTTHGLEASRA